MKDKKQGVQIYLRGFPEDLHKKVKIRAAVEEVTMKDWVIEACREKLERVEDEG